MDKLSHYRKRIDEIDQNLVEILSLRFKLAEQIAVYKKSNKLRIADKSREAQVINNIIKHSNRKHKKFLKEIFGDVINYSKNLQRRSR